MKISRRIFDATCDLIRIQGFRVLFASLFSFWLIHVFTILISLFNGLSFSAVTLASILARVISVVNFTLNHMVFKNEVNQCDKNTSIFGGSTDCQVYW